MLAIDSHNPRSMRNAPGHRTGGVSCSTSGDLSDSGSHPALPLLRSARIIPNFGEILPKNLELCNFRWVHQKEQKGFVLCRWWHVQIWISGIVMENRIPSRGECRQATAPSEKITPHFFRQPPEPVDLNVASRPWRIIICAFPRLHLQPPHRRLARKPPWGFRSWQPLVLAREGFGG